MEAHFGEERLVSVFDGERHIFDECNGLGVHALPHGSLRWQIVPLNYILRLGLRLTLARGICEGPT